MLIWIDELIVCGWCKAEVSCRCSCLDLECRLLSVERATFQVLDVIQPYSRCVFNHMVRKILTMGSVDIRVEGRKKTDGEGLVRPDYSSFFGVWGSFVETFVSIQLHPKGKKVVMDSGLHSQQGSFVYREIKLSLYWRTMAKIRKRASLVHTQSPPWLTGYFVMQKRWHH